MESECEVYTSQIRMSDGTTITPISSDFKVAAGRCRMEAGRVCLGCIAGGKLTAVKIGTAQLGTFDTEAKK